VVGGWCTRDPIKPGATIAVRDLMNCP